MGDKRMAKDNHQEQLAERLFKKWDALLDNDTKSLDNLESTFADLFYELYNKGVDFNLAIDYLSRACSAVVPPKDLVTMLYKSKGIARYGKSERDWLDDWKKKINKIAYTVFYSYYKEQEGENREDPMGKMYGQMDSIEYEKQMRYAYSHPLVNLSEVNLEKDTIDMLDAVLKKLEETEEGENGE